MGVPFDHITISNSATAKTVSWQLQRKFVWSYINSIFPQLNGHEMLELNAGSGEDALVFGSNGCNIVATDIGVEMVKITTAKDERFSMANGISAHFLDLDTLDATLFDKKFDLVFSNFDTVNKTNPESLKLLLKKLPQILNPGGRFVGVVMPKFCAWESAYFLLNFDFRKIFRRLRKSAVSNQSDFDLRNWFYNPSEISQWSKQKFRLVSVQPLGLLLPPVSLENVLRVSKKMLIRLGNVESKMANMPLLARFSDHFIIDLQLI